MSFADFIGWTEFNTRCSFRFVNDGEEEFVDLSVSTLRVKQPLRLSGGEAVFTDISGQRKHNLNEVEYYRDFEFDYKELADNTLSFAKVVLLSLETMVNATGEIWLCPTFPYEEERATQVLYEPDEETLGVIYDDNSQKLPAKGLWKSVNPVAIDSTTVEPEPSTGGRSCLDAPNSLSITQIDGGYKASFSSVLKADAYAVEYSFDEWATYELEFVVVDDLADPQLPFLDIVTEEDNVCVRVRTIQFCPTGDIVCYAPLGGPPVITQGAYMQIVTNQHPPVATPVGMWIRPDDYDPEA